MKNISSNKLVIEILKPLSAR